MMYRHQLRLALERGDAVLAKIYQFIARDEAAHADFYRRVTQLEVEEDRAGAVRDMAVVFKNFRMPGTDLVPDYAQRTEQMRLTSGVDRGAFLKEVWFPTLKKARHQPPRSYPGSERASAATIAGTARPEAAAAARRDMDSKAYGPSTPIAIVGIGCRFPEATDADRFWARIARGQVAFREIPRDRWNHEIFYTTSQRDVDKTWTASGSFIDGYRDFAALHYGIAPRRLEVMDPSSACLSRRRGGR